MKKLYLLVIVFFLLPVIVFPQPLAVINSFSARNYALAQADAVMQGDVDALLINPSGLADIHYLTVGAFYTHWLEDMQFYSLRTAYPLTIRKKSYGTVGIDLSAFSITPIPFYDEEDRRQSDLNASDFSGSLGYGYKLWRRYNLGLTLKYYHTVLGEKFYDHNVFDFGFSTDFLIPSLSRQNRQKNIKTGFAIQNIDMLYSNFNNSDQDNVLLPLKLKAGGNYTFYSETRFESMLLASVNWIENYDLQYNIGMELLAWKILRIQGGYIINPYMSYHFTFGSGILFKSSATSFIFDYAVIPLNNFSTQHAFSFKMQFK